MSRSLLFVPGDSERKLAKAADVGADGLILDLEDSVAAARRPHARALVAEYLKAGAAKKNWVRINPLHGEDAFEDLRAVVGSGPTGIVLPKPHSARDVIALAELLDELERGHGMPHGQTEILPIVTEQPVALFKMDSYVDATPRLAGLSWGAEDLSAAIGASTNKDESGNWLAPYELARCLTLFAAAAARVPAIDTVYTDFRDNDGLARYAGAARRDGFGGMLAIHPAQVPVINEAFTPSSDEIDRARKIVALFADSPEAGVLAMDGEMLDQPHLVQARRLLHLVNRISLN